jgi:hypothetical protein
MLAKERLNVFGEIVKNPVTEAAVRNLRMR